MSRRREYRNESFSFAPYEAAPWDGSNDPGGCDITTDPHGMNHYYNFTKDEMVIVSVGGAREIATAFVELVNDCFLLFCASDVEYGAKRRVVWRCGWKEKGNSEGDSEIK